MSETASVFNLDNIMQNLECGEHRGNADYVVIAKEIA